MEVSRLSGHPLRLLNGGPVRRTAGQIGEEDRPTTRFLGHQDCEVVLIHRPAPFIGNTTPPAKLEGRPVPVRRILPHLMDLVVQRGINPDGRSREMLPLRMNRAIKTFLRSLSEPFDRFPTDVHY